MEEDAQEWPYKITIGTRRAYEKNYFWLYERMTVNGEQCYVADKGSDYSRGSELMVLRRECFRGDDGEMIIWTAYDAFRNPDRSVTLRQAVFRAINQHIQQPGWYQWQQNGQAAPHNNGQPDAWDEKFKLRCETKVISQTKPM